MKHRCTIPADCRLLTVAISFASDSDKVPAMLSHDVYFTLKDDSPQAREALVAALQEIPLRASRRCLVRSGPLVEEHQRDVNDVISMLPLHIVFKDKASHDKYQAAEAHTSLLKSSRRTGSLFASSIPGSRPAHTRRPVSHGENPLISFLLRWSGSPSRASWPPVPSRPPPWPRDTLATCRCAHYPRAYRRRGPLDAALLAGVGPCSSTRPSGSPSDWPASIPRLHGCPIAANRPKDS